MGLYRNLLIISRGAGDQLHGLKQAFRLARSSRSRIDVLVVPRRLPASLERYRQDFEVSLAREVSASIDSLRASQTPDERKIKVKVDVETGDLQVTRIIRRMLRNGNDAVFKEAEPLGSGRGFRSIEMELLRNCPHPVWLNRPAGDREVVAVAVDPEGTEKWSRDFAVRLLKHASDLAGAWDRKLHVISCWNYELEEYLRGSGWIDISEAELARDIAETQLRHRAALDGLIEESDISPPFRVHHLRGEAEEMIPMTVTEQAVEVLVMGTVGRRRIPGYIIGNTAENIIQSLDCSLLALKPSGFVTPIEVV